MKTVLKLLFVLSILMVSCRQIPKDEDLINEDISSKYIVGVKLKLNEGVVNLRYIVNYLVLLLVISKIFPTSL